MGGKTRAATNCMGIFIYYSFIGILWMKIEVELIEVVDRIPTRIKLGTETYLLVNVREAEILQPVQLADDKKLPKLSKSKRKKRKPKGSVGFDESYHHWVSKKEIDMVKKILREEKTLQIFESLMEKTGMKLHHIRATLHYMRAHNMLIRKHCGYKNKRSQVIYQPISDAEINQTP